MNFILFGLKSEFCRTGFLLPNMCNKRVKRGNANTHFKELQRWRDRRYITDYPHESKKNGCTLMIVESLLKRLSFLAGDHGFMEDTYQEALKNNLDNFRDEGML